MNSRIFHLSKQNFFKLIGLGATATLFFKIISNSLSTSSYKLNAKEYEHSRMYEKLINVQLITRHGARTPLHLIPGIEEVFSVYF
jgi:hypothetical protein